MPLIIDGFEQPCKSLTIFTVSAPALKNIKKNVEAAHTAKLKEEQAAKTKKGKGKGASLKMGTDKVAVTRIFYKKKSKSLLYASHLVCFTNPSPNSASWNARLQDLFSSEAKGGYDDMDDFM